MNFWKRLKEYSDRLFAGEWNSPFPKSAYDAEYINRLLAMDNSFAKYVGLTRFEAGDSKNSKKVLDLLEDKDEIIRFCAVSRIALTEGKQLDKYIKKSLHDESRYVRIAGLTFIRKKGETAFYEDVQILLSDRKYDVRMEAANKMQKIDAHKPYIHIVNLLFDVSKQNRKQAVKILRNEYPLLTIGYIYNLSQTDRDAVVRQLAEQAVNKLLCEGIVYSARSYIFSDKLQDDSVEVIISLLQLDDERVIGLIHEVLSSQLINMDNIYPEDADGRLTPIARAFVIKQKQDAKTKLSLLQKYCKYLAENSLTC